MIYPQTRRVRRGDAGGGRPDAHRRHGGRAGVHGARGRICSWDGLWYLGTLVPVIGLVRAGDQAMADRFTYIPSIGLGFMGAWIGRRAARADPWARGAAVTVAAAATLVAWGMVARAQVETWRDDRALYTHALAVTSRQPPSRTATWACCSSTRARGRS